MIAHKTIQSPWGPVKYELVACDSLSCTEVQQPDLACGWLKVEDYGMPVRSLGSNVLREEDMHFCSATCLKEYLS